MPGIESEPVSLNQTVGVGGGGGHLKANITGTRHQIS